MARKKRKKKLIQYRSMVRFFEKLNDVLSEVLLRLLILLVIVQIGHSIVDAFSLLDF